MPISITISVTDAVTPEVKLWLETLRPGVMESAMGRAGQQHLQGHFGKLNSTRTNRLGGRRTNFYAQAARSTNYTAGAGVVELNVSGPVGIAQRYRGGFIHPVNVKYLTIPVHRLAYGRRAKEFTDLSVLWSRKGGIRRPYALAVGLGTKQTGKSDSRSKVRVPKGTILFLLVREVFQKADKTVLPTDSDLEKAVRTGAEEFIASRMARPISPIKS
jgi:hypothetical protein